MNLRDSPLLCKKKERITLLNGSGVSEIRSQKCKVRLDSNYQFRFSLNHPEESKHQFMVSIPAKDEVKVYVNGIRIYFEL